MRTQPNYGIDRPDIVTAFTAAGAVFLVLAALSVFRLDAAVLWISTLFAVAAWFVVGSKIVKPRVAADLLGSIPWRGDETVLDIGCGRGLLLIMAAKRLSTGRAVGIDVWNRRLQSGNRPAKTLENARIEGVANRVTVADGDASRLPFDDGTFDIVVTSLVFHHLEDSARQRALEEVARVLKPGGYLAMIELSHARAYAQVLSQLGIADVEVSPRKVQLFFGTRTLKGKKALSGNPTAS